MVTKRGADNATKIISTVVKGNQVLVETEEYRSVSVTVRAFCLVASCLEQRWIHHWNSHNHYTPTINVLIDFKWVHWQATELNGLSKDLSIEAKKIVFIIAWIQRNTCLPVFRIFFLEILQMQRVMLSMSILVFFFSKFKICQIWQTCQINCDGQVD